MSGESVGLVKKIEPVEEIINNLTSKAESFLENLNMAS